MKNIPLILASASPRRKEILSLLNIPFQVIPAQIEEIITPPKDAMQMAYEKAETIYEKKPKSFIIGADTIVVCNNKILEKPKSKFDAKNMIKNLSYKQHSVFTGVAVIGPDIIAKDLIETKVWVNCLEDWEIDEYLKEENVLDAAGAYKIQGCFSRYINKISGDFFNVVGLPLFWIYNNLKNFLIE